MSKAIKDKNILAEFARTFDYCWACGVPGHRALWPGLQIHHIVKPGRSDERANLSRLCNHCHCLAEGHSIRNDAGILWPWITLPRCLWLKKRIDPRNYDRARLQELYGQSLPRATKVPIVFLREWAKNQGGTGL